MKTTQTRSVYLSFSGAAGTLAVPLPDKGRIVGVDFALGWMVGELAAATGISYVSAFIGTPITGSNGASATSLLASVYEVARSNATFAIQGSLNKFVPMSVPFSRNAICNIDYTVFSNHQISGWITLYIEV